MVLDWALVWPFMVLSVEFWPCIIFLDLGFMFVGNYKLWQLRTGLPTFCSSFDMCVYI